MTEQDSIVHSYTSAYRRKQITEIALRLFLRLGYAGTSLSDLSEEIGITKPAIYNHFRSKEDILLNMVGPVLDDVALVLNQLERDREEGHSIERRQVLENYLDIFLRHRDVMTLLGRDVSLLGHPYIKSRVERQNAQLVSLLVGENASPEERMNVYGVLAIFQIVVASFSNVEPERVRSHVLTMADSLLALGA